MTVRIITTRSSVWSFDEERKEFNRSPRQEGFEHPIVDYTGDWQSYVALQEVDMGERVHFFVETTNPMDSLRSSYLKSEQVA